MMPIYWVNRLSALTRRELVGRFKAAGHDISPEEWAVLLLLWHKDGQNPGDMSARTVRDPTTMTRLIDGLVRKGVVERRMDSNDRRRSNICLTQKGRALQPTLVGLAMPMIGQGMEGIAPEDIETTMRVLQRMVENLSQNQKQKAKS